MTIRGSGSAAVQTMNPRKDPRPSPKAFLLLPMLHVIILINRLRPPPILDDEIGQMIEAGLDQPRNDENDEVAESLPFSFGGG